MESLSAIVRRKLREGFTHPQDLGREVARVVPRNWKITVYAVMRAGISKGEHLEVFQAFFEEQRLKPKKWKSRGSKKNGHIEEEEDDPEQLDLELG